MNSMINRGKKFCESILRGASKGIVLLLILAVLIYIVVKAVEFTIYLIRSAGELLANVLGIEGNNSITTIALFIILSVVLSLLFQIKRIGDILERFEDLMLSLIPGYRLMKSIARSQQDSKDTLMKPVLMLSDDEWQPGFLIQENDHWATVFIPDVPQVNAGEVKITARENIVILPISNLKMTIALRDYGLHVIDWIKATPQKYTENSVESMPTSTD